MLARLRAMGMDVPVGAYIRRVYASPADRNAGAWSWAVMKADGNEARVGSQYSIGELLRGRLVASRGWAYDDDWDIDPYREGDQPVSTRHLKTVLVEPE
jgi:hypothetical protein